MIELILIGLTMIENKKPYLNKKKKIDKELLYGNDDSLEKKKKKKEKYKKNKLNETLL